MSKALRWLLGTVGLLLLVIAMADPILGNIKLQLRAGQVVRPDPVAPATCNAQLSGDAVHADDMCPYADIAALIGAPLYTGDGDAGGWTGTEGMSLTTDAPWNGKQALRLADPSEGGPHLLGNEDDIWFRARLRFSSGSFANGFTFFQFGRFSGPGSLIIGHQTTPSESIRVRETWTGTDYAPPSVAMDDENDWDVIIHMVRAADGTGNVQMNAWVGRSDGVGGYTSILNATVPNEVMSDPFDRHSLYFSSPFPGDRMDVGSWETADGAATPNPFGALP